MTDLNDDKTRTHTVLTQGTRVSHYLIIEKIGAGGMGEVYLAEDTKLARKVALKFLPSHLCQDDDCRARFKREAQAAAKLDNANIVPIYDAEEFQGRPFIAMAYIEGVLLRDKIKENNISIDDAIAYTRQICEGLQEAHQAGVVHRDIKPGNIIIDNSNKARLLDFGLATIQGAEKLTRAGSTLGTVGYMSPEQICGEEVEARSDLFSVGVILYEMITGRSPFREDYEAATMNAILNKTPDPLTRYKSNIPDELQRAVFKLLEKKSSLRYQSAAGLLSDLNRMEALTAEKSKGGAGQTDQRQMLVVMPFENLGPPEEEYFADGMTEEIISRLATIRELGVISRTSAMTYKQTAKSIREIGSELGVAYVLEGSVRWNRKGKDSDRVRITPQLIRVSDDTHLWSDRYDRTLDDIFEVQTQIAEQVVEQLNIQLVGSKQRVLQAKPTANLEAYQFYLRGLEYAGRPDYAQQDFRMAQQMFERAVELDPKFALAYADLSRTHSLLYFHGYDRSPDGVSRARMAVERANSLRPEMAEVHLAFGYFHYYCKQNLDLAFEELNKVQKYFPNDSRVLALTGAIVKRQGRFAEAVEYYKKAFETSPRDASLPHEIGCAYMTMRDYSKAGHYYDLSIAISSSQVSVFVCKAWNYWLWQGDVSKGQETLTQVPEEIGTDLFDLFQAKLFARNYDEALKTLTAAPEIFDVGQWYLIPKALFKAYAYQLLGDNERARAQYESAREFLEREVEKRPDDDRIRASLGNVYAGLGRTDEAVREAKLAVALMPVSENAVVGPFRVVDLAFTYTLLGERESAIDQLEYLLSIPSWMSVPLLHIDPKWDSLRNHSRFQMLLEKGDKT